MIPRAAAYCASKHALEAFTDGLRVRACVRLLALSCVCRGGIRAARARVDAFVRVIHTLYSAHPQLTNHKTISPTSK